MRKGVFFRININRKDIEILEFICAELGGDIPIKFAVVNGSKQAYIMVYSRYMVDTLVSYGLTSRKTYDLKYPDCVSESFHHSFIRGLFDGDGSISLVMGRKRRSNLDWSLAGTKELLEKVQDVLVDKAGVSRTKISLGQGIYRLRYKGNRQVERIYNFLYKDASFYLKRKKDIFDTIICQEEGSDLKLAG